MKKLVLFGAGKIGRSFIGQLFSCGGYEVVFVDIFKPVIDELNKRKAYNVIIKENKGDSIIKINNVSAVLADDKDKVMQEVAQSDLIAVSVGQRGLAGIMPLIAGGLTIRYNINPYKPLDIIIAENLRNANEYFENELKTFLPDGYPFSKLVGLIETSIGKMVPIMLKKDMDEDILQVFAEPYNTLILDKKGFKNPIPNINGLAPKENMKAWVDRKLFIHNLGHAVTAYLGYVKNPNNIYIWQVLADSDAKKQVRETMLQAADILMAMYPEEFTLQQLTEHIDDLINRFENKALGDTVFRVGCDLYRKLSKEDRLAGAIHNAIFLNKSFDKIKDALCYGMFFRATNEEGKMLDSDITFAQNVKNNIDDILINCCGFEITNHKTIINDIKKKIIFKYGIILKNG